MHAGARGEAPRVAQELGIANVNAMQAGARSEAPRVAQELYIKNTISQKLYITKTLYQNNFISLQKKFSGSTLGNNFHFNFSFPISI